MIKVINLEKGKKLPVGTVRNWKGTDYVKTSRGWRPKKKDGERKKAAEVKQGEQVTSSRQWVDKLAHLPDQTTDVHFKDGEPTPERKILHDSIVSWALGGTNPVEPGKKPVAVFMMGGPASGKTTMVKSSGDAQENFVKADADSVKERLPEYKEALAGNARNAASMAHKESSYIVRRIHKEAIESNRNIVIDGTGGILDAYYKAMDMLRSKGYSIRLMYADCIAEEAVVRNRYRSEKEGRYVPDSIITEKYAAIPKNFEEFALKVDEFVAFDTRGIHLGKPARLVMSGRGNDVQVHDEIWYEQFRNNKSLPPMMQKSVVSYVDEPDKSMADLVNMFMRGFEADRKYYEHLKTLPTQYKYGDGVVDIPYELGDEGRDFVFTDRMKKSLKMVIKVSAKSLEKSKAYPVGTRRTHGGILVVKTSKGWRPVKKDAGVKASEEDD